MVKFKSARALPAGRRPSVSVVVPCYNYGRFLSQCVGSLLTQPSVDVDVLIIDDASPDGSGEIAREIAAADPRVSVLQHEQNRGHIATYNEGLELARGDYSVLLSADDVLPVGSLARAVALMEADPSVGFVYGHPVNFSDPDPPMKTNRTYGWSVWSGPAWVRAQCRRGLSCIYSPEVVMRTSVRKSVGGFRKGLPHSADLELWLRFAAVSCVGRINGTAQAYRRVHGASMMQSSYSSALVDLRERKRTFDAYFAAEGATISGAAKSREIVLRRLSAEALEVLCNHLQAGGDPSAADDYVRFARETYPAVQQLRAWTDYELTASAADGAWTGARRRGHAAVRDLQGRLRYRRWQLTGM